MSVLIDNFTSEQIVEGLRWLDNRLGLSDVLQPVLPVNLVSYGGMLSVCLFENRQTTEDIDVLLPPDIRETDAYREEFTRLSNSVADDLGYMRDWINDDLRLFVPRDDRPVLVGESIEQGTAVFEGDDLVIWAGLWEFGLESKLRRMGDNGQATAKSRRKYGRDLSDAVDLLHRIRGVDDDSAKPLDEAWVKGLRRYPQRDGIKSPVLQAVAAGYVAKYGTQGMVELVWDEEEKRRKFENLEGKWVWHD